MQQSPLPWQPPGLPASSDAAAAAWAAPGASTHSRPAATKHGVLHAAFANINWKDPMGGKNFARHAKELYDTISSIVEEAAPAVICMCEVGLPHTPLQPEHFARLRNVVAQAWKVCCPAATEHGVEFLYTDGEPYLSAYRPDMITCTAHTTMQDLYLAGGQPRTAQHFLATPACGGYSGANIINVHAPSGTRRLKDSQRRCLLTRLLQSTSLRDSRMRVGMDNFIIGAT